MPLIVITTAISYPVINNATVNGVISTYYLDDGISTNTNANSLTRLAP